MRLLPVLPLLALPLLPVAGQADVYLTEFLASNQGGLQDEDGEDSDWIEVTNFGAAPVNLQGWGLTDEAGRLDKWIFPDVLVPSGEAVLVFASGKDRRDAGEELHANFRLSAAGEFLALVRPDHVTIAHQFEPAFPPQYPNVSYGVEIADGQLQELVGPGGEVSFRVPDSDRDDVNVPSAEPRWHEPGYDDQSWARARMGLGFPAGGEAPFGEFVGVGGEVEGLMREVSGTLYARLPFQVDSPGEVNRLILAARHDDGFAAYLNGARVPVASANSPAPELLGYRSTATAGRDDEEAAALEEFEIPLADGALRAGENLLAIHALNVDAADPDFLIDVELGAILKSGVRAGEGVYMVSPTPGEPNAAGVASLGPIFREATDALPEIELPDAGGVVVTASVQPAGAAIESVQVSSRVMFGAERMVAMRDDGVFPDVLAGDGRFSAMVATDGLARGQMLRWRFEAEDADGRRSRLPAFQDPRNAAEYFGTIAKDETVVSQLPVLHWFVRDTNGADTRSGTRASAFFRGEFYDNFFVRIRGGSTAGFPKKSYKFDFNSREHFRFDPDAGRAEEINLNQTWSDKAYIRQSLSFEVYDLAGSPGSESFLVRLQRNGLFHSLNVLVEQPDKRLLKREGLSDTGALYKMYNGVTSATSGVEKKNRRHEDNADLALFVNGVTQLSGAAWERFLFDHVDVPRQLNYLVATVLTQNNDNMRKNFYLYRDSDGTGEWFQIPWDTDLTWGSHYMTGDSSAHDGIWAAADYVLGGRNQDTPISPSHPFVGTRELPGNRSWSRLIDQLHGNPRFAEMFRRRLRTVMDDAFAAPLLDERIAALQAMIGRDAELDRAKWGQFGQAQRLATAMSILQRNYLVPRRLHLFETHLAENAAAYPTPQTSSAMLPAAQGAPDVEFGRFDGNPASGRQDDEFVELVNPNAVAVDLSGWSVEGGVRHLFRPGTVIESGGRLFLSPSVPAFRARGESPRGGEGNFVQGDYEGQISARGEVLTLLDRDGRVVATLTTPGNPSATQQFLRITELAFAPLDGTDAEFIELKNVGTTTLDLAGVRFTEGVRFQFGAGASLGPGEIGILVRDPARFPGANILGVYEGGLQNSGEQLTLRDAVGENIQSFEYEGGWFPPAMTAGFTIEIRDDALPWDSWDDAASWVMSCVPGGSAGLENPEAHGEVFEAWQRLHFDAEALADPEISGPEADANLDGIPNLLDYALARDPHAGGGAGLPIVVVEAGVPRFLYRRWVKAADIDYLVEGSRDLVSWQVVEEEGLPMDLGDGTELVEVAGESRPAAPQQFFRLRVVRR